MSEGNEDLLKVLLESILNIKIVKITYLNLEKNNGNIHIRRKHFDFHVKTDTENIHIEVNNGMRDYVRPRNMAYICNTYSNAVLSGEEYDEDTKFIQINFTYGLGKKEKGLRIYNIQDEDNVRYVNNFCIYEFNMDYYMNLWYSKDERGIEDNKYLIMMDLKPKELELLSKKDRVISKYMGEIERININSELYEYMSAEEDNRKIENSLKTQFRKEGLAEGRAEGRVEGRAEGRVEGLAEGRAEGKQEATLEHAKKMLEKNIDINDISDITGLSIDEINSINK